MILQTLSRAAVLLAMSGMAGVALADVPAPAPRVPPRANTAATDIAEYRAVRAVLDLYLEGGRQGKSSVMRPAFHPDAIMYGDPTGTVQGGPIKALFDYIDTHPAAPGLKAEVVRIEVQDTIASARVESGDWNGARFSDMFLLVKVDGHWKIITKVFRQYPA